MTEREAALALVGARGVGPRTAEALRSRYGSYAAALARGVGDARVPEAVRRSLTERTPRVLARELRELEREGIAFVELGAPAYPGLLEEIHGPPPGLFMEGAPPGTELHVAVVGARRAAERSLVIARALGRGLAARGVSVVSGLARGVDSAAHRGALSAGGRTVAVLGSGLRRIYPPENAGLAREIVDSGCVVSEFPPRLDARPSHFPRRNRVVAGLSAAVVVVEASDRSGALITAALALDEGREVLACPGPAGEAAFRGSNRLIRDGARLVESAEDVLEDLEGAWGPFLGAVAETAPRPRPELSERAVSVLGALSLEAVSPDEAAAAVAAPIEVVLSALVELELAGVARRVAGGRYVVSDEESARRRRTGDREEPRSRAARGGGR